MLALVLALQLLACAGKVVARRPPFELVTVPDPAEAATAANYITVDMSTRTGSAPIFASRTLNLTSGSMKPTTGHLLVLYNPIKRISVKTGNVGNGTAGCGHRILTRDTAKTYKCVVATNAGFFDMSNGNCIGNIVTDGRVVELPATRRINFGVTRTNKFLIGYLDKPAIAAINASDHILDLVQGAGWLVKDGKVNVDAANTAEGLGTGFVNQKAPRTLVGVDKDANLLLFEIDGDEETAVGPDLYETADLALKHGFVQAVNLDGGGSSTYVLNGVLCSGCGIQYATCDHSQSVFAKEPDVVSEELACERTVTTIMCVS